MSNYQQQIQCNAADLDLGFWRAPEGIEVPDDELRFLLVPDAVEAMAIAEVANKVHLYQAANRETGNAISAALMATMGGMLPGILLHDHLMHGRHAQDTKIAFGTIGVSLYRGPNERYDEPQVQQELSISIENEVVLVIDDLGDRGGTLAFLKEHLGEHGARKVLTLAVYMKPMAIEKCPADFHFGEVAQETWIITPRETVETLVKRVPVWKERGADMKECRRRLVDLIGYRADLVDRYLPQLF